MFQSVRGSSVSAKPLVDKSAHGGFNSHGRKINGVTELEKDKAG